MKPIRSISSASSSNQAAKSGEVRAFLPHVILTPARCTDHYLKNTTLH